MSPEPPAAFRSARNASQRFASLSGREALAGGAVAAVVLALLVGLAFLLSSSRSDVPELVGGGYFIPDRSADSGGAGPPSFNLVDGAPEIRMIGIGKFFAPFEVQSADLVPLNSPVGLYLFDPTSGRLVSFDTNAVPRPFRPYEMARGTRAGPGDPVESVVAGEAVYVVAGGAASACGPGRVGVARFHPDQLLDFTPDADASGGSEAPAAGSSDSGTATGERSTYTAVPACVVGVFESAVSSGDTLWVVTANDDARTLHLVTPAPQDSSADVAVAVPEDTSPGRQVGAEGDPQPTTEVVASFPLGGSAASVAPLADGEGVAVGSLTGGVASVEFFGRDGSTGSATFAQSNGFETFRAVDGGAQTWFLARSQGRLWALGADRSGATEILDLRPISSAQSAAEVAAAAVIDNVLVVGDPSSGQIAAFDVAGGAAVPSFTYRYPAVEGESLNFTGLSVERVGNRFVINLAEASRALLLDHRGKRIAELDKSAPKAIDPDDLAFGELSSQQDLNPDAPRRPADPVPGEVVDPPVDRDRTCEPDEEIGAVRNVVADPRVTQVALEWQYQPRVVTDATCIPTFDVTIRQDSETGREIRRVRSAASDGTEVRGLEPNTLYFAQVTARFETTDKSASSNWVSFQTLADGPAPPRSVTAERTPAGWSVRWEPRSGGGDRVGWLVSADDGTQVTVDGMSSTYPWAFTDSNAGSKLSFSVSAVGVGGQTSDSVTSEAVRSTRAIDITNIGTPDWTDDKSKRVGASPTERTVTASWQAPAESAWRTVMGIPSSIPVEVTFTVTPKVGSETTSLTCSLDEVVPAQVATCPFGTDLDASEVSTYNWSMTVTQTVTQKEGRSDVTVRSAKPVPLGRATCSFSGEPTLVMAQQGPDWSLGATAAFVPTDCASGVSVVPRGGSSFCGANDRVVTGGCSEVTWTFSSTPAEGYQAPERVERTFTPDEMKDLFPLTTDWVEKLKTGISQTITPNFSVDEGGNLLVNGDPQSKPETYPTYQVNIPSAPTPLGWGRVASVTSVSCEHSIAVGDTGRISVEGAGPYPASPEPNGPPVEGCSYSVKVTQTASSLPSVAIPGTTRSPGGGSASSPVGRHLTVAVLLALVVAVSSRVMSPGLRLRRSFS